MSLFVVLACPVIMRMPMRESRCDFNRSVTATDSRPYTELIVLRFAVIPGCDDTQYDGIPL